MRPAKRRDPGQVGVQNLFTGSPQTIDDLSDPHRTIPGKRNRDARGDPADSQLALDRHFGHEVGNERVVRERSSEPLIPTLS